MKRKRMAFIHIKTAYRLGMLLYIVSVLFVSPYFLIALVPYVLFRLFAWIEYYDKYDVWKRLKYGEGDRNLTVRKLLYFINQAKKYDLRNAYEYTTFDFKGKIHVDEHTYIKMERECDEFTYTCQLYFEEQLIGTFNGFSFQKINWSTQSFPEIERALLKFTHHVEKEIQQAKKEKKRALTEKKKMAEKMKIAQEKVEKQKEKELAKRIHKAYKKDSSL